MPLKFRITIEPPESPNILDKVLNVDNLPKPILLSELDVLSMIRMSKTRNKNLSERLIDWYRRIDHRLRLIA